MTPVFVASAAHAVNVPCSGTLGIQFELLDPVTTTGSAVTDPVGAFAYRDLIVSPSVVTGVVNLTVVGVPPGATTRPQPSAVA